MLQNKVFSKFLITCSCLSLLVGEVNAVAGFSDVFEDDNDVQKTLSGSINDVLKEKAVKKRNAYKLSDKGDLQANDGRTFREFLMKGDGNCALYAMGTNHTAAKALFLANARNQVVRDLAHQEIVDEFNNLPPEMQAKQKYVELKDSLADVQRRLSTTPADQILLRLRLISREEAVRRRIREYAKSEETYIDYVNHVLVNGHHMRFRQDGGGNQGTYFIDALAFLLNKNLTIWSQVDYYQITIENHPGRVRDDTYLIPSHHYWGEGFYTLNIIHRNNNHFNRLVLLHDRQALDKANRDEEEAMGANAFADLNHGLLKNNKFIEYHLNKRIVEGAQFSEAGKKEARAKIADLEKQRGSGKKALRTKQISSKELKAYCIALVRGSRLMKEDLRKDAEINIEQVKAEINKRYPAAQRATNNGARLRFEEAMQDAEKLAPKKAAAIAEIQKIDHQISVLEKVSNSINEVISEDNIFAALSASIFSIGQENEDLEERIKRKKVSGPKEEVAHLEKQVKENLFTKKIFEKLYSVYEKENRENVKNRLQSNLNKSKKRVETWLGTNQTLNGGLWVRIIPLVDDFRAAKAALDRVVQDKKQQNVPYLNPDYIIHDPYLLTHNRDVHTEYPQQINDSEWRKFKQDVGREAREYLRTNEGIDAATRQDTQESLNTFESVLQQVDIDPDDEQEAREHTLRKRIKRILDTLISQAGEGDEARLSAYARFVRLMTQNVGRCIDGVEIAVEEIEEELIYSSSGGNFAEHTISKILTSDRHNFIQQHDVYGGDSVEQRTAIPLLLLQRMRYPLSLRGEPTDIAYPSFGKGTDPNLQPAKVMERYLQGGQYAAQQRQRLITTRFEARTPKKLVSLLYEAYERGVNKITNHGPTFSNQELTDFALYDDKMKSLYQAFGNAFAEGEVIKSDYFEIRNRCIGYKRAFFEYMLKRLGYIIDPRNPSINILPSQQPILIPVKAAPARPVVVAAPARPVVVAAPARPVVVAAPARPVVVAAPARPVVVAAPARPVVVAAPARPVVVAAPARPVVIAAPARPVVVAAPARKPAAVKTKTVSRKAAPARKSVVRKPTAVKTKTVSRKAAPARKSVVRKPTAVTKTVSRKVAPARKSVVRKPTAVKTKTVSRKVAPARKSVVRKLAAVKTKTASRKAPPQKSRFVRRKAKAKPVVKTVPQRGKSVRGSRASKRKSVASQRGKSVRGSRASKRIAPVTAPVKRK